MDMLKFKVTGAVQGVFFRDYTQKEALKLGIRGWCHNHPDESVEGAAVGSSEALAKFKEYLWKGSPSADVSHVDLDEVPKASQEQIDQAIGSTKGFDVRSFRR